MKNNRFLKKFLTSVIAIMCIVIMFFGLLQAPFVAAAYIIEHPVSVICDFLGDFLGLSGSAVENQSIYQLSDIYYESDSSIKKKIDNATKKYEGVSSTNLALPFMIFQYRSVTTNDIDNVAKWLSENASSGLNEDEYIDFMITSSIFKEKIKSLKYDKEFISSLFGQDYTGGTNEGADITPGELELGNKIAKRAYTRLGCRYWWGAPGGGFGDKQNLDDPNAKYFDCSGFVAWSHRQAGVKIGRSTASGYSKSGSPVSYENLQTGDVITFSYDGGRTVAHIGIYIGDGNMIHASGQGSGTVGQYANQQVKTQSIAPGSYYYKYIYNCRRLF